MKKTIVSVTGARLDKELVKKINKFVENPKHKSMVFAPKLGHGQKDIKIQVDQIDVKFGLMTTLRYKLLGF